MNGWVAVLGISEKIHQCLHPAEIKVLWRQVLLVGQAEIYETKEIVEGSLIFWIYAHGWDCNPGEDTTQEAAKFAILDDADLSKLFCSQLLQSVRFIWPDYE
jgi:hypothetical protein